jgi:hypothetical protein
VQLHPIDAARCCLPVANKTGLIFDVQPSSEEATPTLLEIEKRTTWTHFANEKETRQWNERESGDLFFRERVELFRESADFGYAFLADPLKMKFMAVTSTPGEVETRLQRAFEEARRKYQYVVLAVFRHSEPRDLAKIYQKLLKSNNQYFFKIVVAVPDEKTHQIFRETLNPKKETKPRLKKQKNPPKVTIVIPDQSDSESTTDGVHPGRRTP